MDNFNIINNLAQYEKNAWPPNINKIIIIKHPQYKENFIGKVYKCIWDNTAVICLLLNNKNYIEPVLQNNDIIKGNHNGKGLFLLLPTYQWTYIDQKKFYKYLNSFPKEKIDEIDFKIKTNYNSMINNNDKNQTIINHKNLTETIEGDKKKKSCDNFVFKDDSLLTKQGDPDLNNLFTENDNIEIIVNYQNSNFVPPYSEAMDLIQKKLLLYEEIKETDKQIAVSRMLSLENIINSKYDEEWEAKKIISWLKDKLINDDFYKNIGGSGLKLFHHNGYVYILREGIDSKDKITTDLVPNLNYLKWQYGYPIDYNTLKFLLFQNKFQKNIQKDKIIAKEASNILSQEYIISLQPEPEYHMWCVKRLILCWYADTVLQNNIRKIKILINQWRAKGNEKFNIQHGTLPSIVIYPKYGAKSARIVIKKLGEYFFFYKNIGWECSKPSYFIQIDKLMYYTNGLLDLKLYYRHVLSQSKTSLHNDDIFTKKYTKFTQAADFFKI
ncbi:Hypothetical protein KVN_LOCUS304 [uncultured virus]|nr:Hypothetical protein KVN_LOCUS304 [uncultured virus]